MKQLAKLDEFYKSLKDISVINSDLDEKRDELKKEVYAFNDTIQKRDVDKNITKQNKEMAELLKGTIGLIKESSNSWVVNFEEMLEKEKFRSDLANYFIIIIFGKVKAGKSSLGNFIAKHKLEKQTVEFFKYDEAGKKQAIKKLEEIDEESFDTNNLECTVEIQGFKLDGMAWIDTPGLGSMVKENGDLAKEYIQSADYVIYPTSSDSPLQQDETQQLKELFEQNKKVTICITKSDEKEEDECECGSEDGCAKCESGLIEVLQNKSSSNREKQERYVNYEINKIIKSDKESVLGDIFSISSHTAAKGLEDKNNELFENSNMPKFYDLITKVVKEKATKLKEKTPYDGLKSFIDNNIIGSANADENSIANIKQALKNLDEKIDETLERFQVLQNNANSDLESEVESVVSEYYSKIDKSNSKEIFVTIDEELSSRVSTVIQNNIHEIFSDFDTTLQSLTTSFGTNEFEIEDTYKTIDYTTETRNKKIGSGFFGTIATIGTGIALASNPVGWAVAGAIAAGAGVAGSYIGGKLGEATGSNQTEKIRVGDNKEEVIQKFKSMRLDYYEKFAKDMYQQMQDTFFIPLQKSSSDINSDLKKFENSVKNIL
ncbi:MAG: dynamin family protein [Campylobacterota bacterium]|nr:dynamin family protein [Campylobacterota bacterium]